METRANYVMIGLFTLAVIAGAFGFVFWFQGGGASIDRGYYRIAFDGSVNGLRTGSAVMFNGLRVGEVTALALNPKQSQQVLVTVAVDFCGRPAFVWKVQGLEGKWIGDFDCELTKEFFAAFATRAQCNLHVLLHYGGNAHYTIECIFKAFARACDAATKIDPRLGGAVPSTKGTLTE